jgi:hypothetical protein
VIIMLPARITYPLFTALQRFGQLQPDPAGITAISFAVTSTDTARFRSLLEIAAPKMSYPPRTRV